MRATRPGADRQLAQALRHLVSQATRDLHQHQLACYRCHQAGSDVYAHCAEWWDLAKALHRARRRLAAYEQPDTGDLQLELGLG